MTWFMAAAMAMAVSAVDLPTQLHIALAGPPDAAGLERVSISWYTSSESTNASACWTSDDSPMCSKGNAKAVSKQYISNFGYHHHAYISGLTPGATYRYVVGDATSGPWSSPVVFTAPDSRPSRGPFGMSVFGDMGWLGSRERPVVLPVGGLTSNWSAVDTRATIERLKDGGDIDMVWHLGDIAYADDAFDTDPLTFNYEKVYNGFVDWFQNVSSIMPYMVSVGNHESECHSPICVADLNKYGKPLSNFSAYNARYNMPSSTSDGKLNMWYSFDFGPVHFVSLNSETDFPGAGEENTGDSGFKDLPAGHFGANGEYLAWLERDLAAASANRAQRSWILAGGHRPFVEIGGNGVEALFSKYGVDMYFAGHTHSYQRSLPVRDGVIDQHQPSDRYHNANGTTWVVVGGAGCDEMPDALNFNDVNFGTSSAAISVLKVPGDPYIVATPKLASGVLRVYNGSALHWQLISSHSGDILDDLWITK